MEEFLSFLKKRLEGKVYELNGYKYEFLKVGWDRTLFEFTVNTSLPEKGQGYVLEKIYADVGEIVDNLFSYLGMKSTISIQVYVDGEEVQSSYLPYEKIQQVFDLANERNNKNKWVIRRDVFEFEVEYLPLVNYTNTVQFDDGVTFIVQINVKNILVYDVEKEPDLNSKEKESIFVAYLSEYFQQTPFENAMYEVLEPQLQFRDADDLYYNAYLRISYYKGRKIEDVGVNSDSSAFLGLFHSFDD